jgi:hypothetical protein
VSWVPSPGLISRSSRDRAALASVCEKLAKTSSAVCAMAPCTPPIDSYADSVSVRPRLAPGLQQGVRHQRQPARFVRDVGDDTGGQRALHDQSFRRGGPDDRFPQLRRCHGADQQGGVLQCLGQLGVFGAPAVEVGAYGDDDAGARAQQQPDEGCSFGRVAAEGEDLLELVHQDQRALGEQCGMCTSGVRSRREDADHIRAVGPRGCLSQRRDQSRPQQ